MNMFEGMRAFTQVIESGSFAAAARQFTHRLATAQRVLCASPTYLAAHALPMHPRDLAHHSCLHYGHLPETNHWYLMGPDGEHTVTVQGCLCSNNEEVLRAAALQGLGITLLPTFIVGEDLREGTLEAVLPTCHAPEIFIDVLYPVNRHLSTQVRLLSRY